MAQYRSGRIAEEMKKEIADIISNMKDPRLSFVSIIDVKVDTELALAKVYVSYFGMAEADDENNHMTVLKKAAGHMRSELAKRLKTRTVPELKFVEDHSIEEGFKIDDILADYNSKLPK